MWSIKHVLILYHLYKSSNSLWIFYANEGTLEIVITDEKLRLTMVFRRLTFFNVIHACMHFESIISYIINYYSKWVVIYKQSVVCLDGEPYAHEFRAINILFCNTTHFQVLLIVATFYHTGGRGFTIQRVTVIFIKCFQSMRSQLIFMKILYYHGINCSIARVTWVIQGRGIYRRYCRYKHSFL